MMSITHAAIALCCTSVALGTADPNALMCAAIGSQLPDLDTNESIAGRVLYPVSSFIQARYAHRTITHCFLSTVAIAILSFPLSFVNWHLWAAVVIGQFTGWFADCFTKSGCAAFFPNPSRLVIPGNPKARLGTGSSTEYWILGIVIFLAVASINITSAGGISEQFSLAFFRDSATAAKLFHKHGSTRAITIEVDGLNVQTSQAVSERYTILEASEYSIIAESLSSGRLFKIGSAPDVQIQPTSVHSELGQPIKISSQQQALSELAVSDWLKRLPQNAYISGSLLLDEMSQLRLQHPIGEFPSLRVFGGQLELNNARPADLAQIREFWILSGRVVVKVRS